MTPFSNLESLKADKHVKTLQFVFSVYSKSTENVIVIIADYIVGITIVSCSTNNTVDNCNTNKAVAIVQSSSRIYYWDRIIFIGKNQHLNR